MPKNKHSKRALHVITLLTFLFIPILTFTSQASTTPTVYVDPPSTTTQAGANFSANISIAEVTDLCSWEFRLYFKNEILNATEYAEGPFLKSHGSTFLWVADFTNNYNSTHGRVWLTCVRMWTGPGVDGSGTLATITFLPVRGGNTTLHLTNTVLGDSQADPITHTTNDGNVHVLGTSDIAITNVTTSKTIVGQDCTTKINVTIENQGNYTENFNVTTYANTTIIQTKTETLASGNSKTITFTWNTTGYAKGNYTISAYAEPVPGEIDTADNTLTDGTVTVVHPGDLNNDGVVDISDVVLVTAIYRSECGDPEYKPNSDVIEDCVIDIADVVAVTAHYRETDC